MLSTAPRYVQNKDIPPNNNSPTKLGSNCFLGIKYKRKDDSVYYGYSNDLHIECVVNHEGRYTQSDNITDAILSIIFDFFQLNITKTRLYNFDPLKPHFYIVKLGFTGVYIIFLISVQNIDCGYSLEPPRRGGSNEYPQSMFWAEIWKISEFLYLKIFNLYGGKIFNIFE